MGLVGAGLTLGVALGAPLGGVIGKDHALRPLYAGAVMLAVAAVLARVVIAERPAAARRAGLAEIARTALADRALLVPLAFAFVDRFTVGFFTTTFPLYASRVLGASRPEIGFLLAAFLLPFSLLSYPAARLAERSSKAGFVAWGSLGYGVLLAGLGVVSADALPFAMVVLGVLSAVMFVPSLTMLAELAAPAIRSTAMGGFNAAGSLGFLIGPLVGGAVSEGVAATHGWPAGYASAFAVAGTAMVGCVLATAVALRRLVRSGRTR
jgi:MFS family permease